MVCGRCGRKGKEGKGRERKGTERTGKERKGKEGKGRERKEKEGKGRKRKGKEGKGRKRLEMSREKKPLGMSELCCADGCGRRRCKAVAGNGWGEEAAGDERALLRGRLRTASVQGGGWKWVGRRSRWG